MPDIKSVAIAGASGNLGPHVFKALFNANFQVTVLTRGQKSVTYDPSIKVLEVDYTSIDSLTSALQGQDAVVSTIGLEALEDQTVLIDAAIAAGVKRFIPSDFGSTTTNPKLYEYPIYAATAKIQNYLAEKSNVSELSYTILASGASLDMILSEIGIIDFNKHKAEIYDGGDNRISSTSFVSIGKAIAGILEHPKETENRVLHVSQVILTQNKLLAIARELRPDISWELTTVNTSDMMQEALASIGAGDFSSLTMVKFVKSTVFAGDRYGAAYDVTDNELLGVDLLTKEELKKLVADRLG
ncbi:hypothetical protein B0O99DRAFT_584061 [Bisporella sp. PMI_857]|nr:hypothetical protein B0O99DRAFT_584061 [Bisporella sp. PMI_857]